MFSRFTHPAAAGTAGPTEGGRFNQQDTMQANMHDPYQWHAKYNAWFNTRLYDACERLDDAERKRACGAFFGSIHRSLNHLVVADQIWLARMRQCGAENGFASLALAGEVLDLSPGHRLDQPLFEDWAALRRKRAQLDTAISGWVDEWPDGFANWTMLYHNTAGVQRTHPVWQAVTHFFNHQTHHRGQVTTLLMQAGVDVGVTDMVALLSTPP